GVGSGILEGLLRRCGPGRGRSRDDSDVAQRDALQLAIKTSESFIQLEKSPAGKLERVLVGLIHRAARIVHKWSACLFDVCSQDVRYWPIASEVNEPLVALNEGREVRYIKPARINAVAGQKDSS